MSEKIFDAAYYAKQNPDLEQAGITSAPSLQQHFLTLGMHEGREFHPDFNGTAYIESNADLNTLMNAGGNIGGYSKDEINTAGIYHYLNWGINEGRSVPPAPEPPAPPPVVDEGPTLYFSISLSSNVVSFQTNVSGDITMAKSGNDAVFSKPGGYQQTQTDFFTAETNFTLSDGQVLATTADVITGLVPTSTGSGRIKVTGADGIQTITGTQGNDELAGGNGSDTFVFEASAADNGKDTISDFTAGANGDIFDFRTALGTTTVTDGQLALGAGSLEQTIANNNIYQIDLNTDIALKDFGDSSSFGELFSTGAGKFSPTVGAGIKAVILVKGTDKTHIYYVDNSDSTFDAFDVTLVAVATVNGTLVADNFV